MGPLQLLLMLGITGVVVLGLLVLVIRLDLGRRLERHRFDRRVRRGTASLLREADRARRDGTSPPAG